MSSTLSARLQLSFSSFRLNVNFTTDAKFVVLFGPSGAGKSTILDCIAGLQTPDNGQIKLDDKVVFDSDSKINLPPQKRQIGYVFQKPALFPHMTVEQNIRFGITNLPQRQQTERLQKILQLWHLDSLEGRKPHELSGGQVQRVALARALAPEPRLLLLDEPLTALHADLRKELSAELKKMPEQQLLSVLMVTHDREEALQLADTVLCLENGEIAAQGRPEELLTGSA